MFTMFSVSVSEHCVHGLNVDNTAATCIIRTSFMWSIWAGYTDLTALKCRLCSYC